MDIADVGCGGVDCGEDERDESGLNDCAGVNWFKIHGKDDIVITSEEV